MGQLDIFSAIKAAKQREYGRRAREKDRTAYNEYMRAWRLNNSAKRRAHELKYRYKVGDFASILEAQGGVCAICEQIPKPNKRNTRGEPGWVVDHDHQSGKVRGVLCAACNNILGLARDDADRIAAALAYLVFHSES